VKVETTKNRDILAVGRSAFLAVLCLGLWLPGRTAQAQMEFAPSLDDATLEKYQGLQLVSRVHVTRAFVDHEKWGFFKIRLAPIGVADGVNVQIFSAKCLTNALDTINPGSISSVDLRHVEFRNLQISLLGEKEPRLRADSARMIRADVMQLSHVSVSNGGAAISISKATLQVSGPDCGCLRWNNAASQEQLFALQTSKK
jgi:hypothetical protein